MATTTVHFPRCDSDEVYRHGLSSAQLSSATGMKLESRVSKSKSLIWLITALVYAIPPER